MTTFRNFHNYQLGQNAYYGVDKTPACGSFAPFDYQCCWINNLLDDHDLDSSSSSISVHSHNSDARSVESLYKSEVFLGFQEASNLTTL